MPTAVLVQALLSLSRHCCPCLGTAILLMALPSMYRQCCSCLGTAVHVQALLFLSRHCYLCVGVCLLLSYFPSLPTFLPASSSCILSHMTFPHCPGSLILLQALSCQCLASFPLFLPHSLPPFVPPFLLLCLPTSRKIAGDEIHVSGFLLLPSSDMYIYDHVRRAPNRCFCPTTGLHIALSIEI